QWQVCKRDRLWLSRRPSLCTKRKFRKGYSDWSIDACTAAQYIRPAQGQRGSAHLESNALAFQGAGPLRSIPKGLHLSAQGCEQRATLGQTNNNRINPERVV